MKEIKEMDKEELEAHIHSLFSEVNYSKTLIQERDTGHIIDYVGRLEERIEELKECLSRKGFAVQG